MKFRIGDRVKFLNDIGGGTITGLVDKRTVNVEDETGFEIPMLISELVLEGVNENPGSSNSFATEEQEEVDEYQDIDNDIIIEVGNNKEVVEDTSEIRFNLAFVPSKPSNFNESGVDAYLINDSAYKLLYNIVEEKDYKAVMLKSGYLDAGTKIMVRTYAPAKLQDNLNLRVQAILFRKGIYDVQNVIDEKIQVKPTKVRKESSYKETEYFEGKALLISVIKDDFAKKIDELSDKDINKEIRKKEPIKAVIKPKNENTDIEEIDLHIEELLDNHQGMSNGEILDVQMSRFETALEGGLRGSTKRMVFIHGVGNGKLKHELRKKLDRKYAYLQYQDASFKEYGYGATMVILKK